jgi:hypothetical protein
MRSIANFRTTSLCIALLLASGCILIPDGKPLSDPYVSPVDEGLCGVWRLDTEEPDLAHYLFIEKSQAKGNPVLLKLVGRSHRTKSTEKSDESPLYCSTTTLGDISYLNVLGSDDFSAPNSYKEWIRGVETDGALNEWAFLIKYRVKEGHLDLWWGAKFSDEAYRKILEPAQTPAEARAALIKHLKSTGGKPLFPETSRASYVRVK